MLIIASKQQDITRIRCYTMLSTKCWNVRTYENMLISDWSLPLISSHLSMQPWATGVPPCPYWWRACVSYTGRPTPWWSRPSRGRCCWCRPCPAFSWPLSTSCWVWPRLLSPRLVSRKNLIHVGQRWDLILSRKHGINFVPLAGKNIYILNSGPTVCFSKV